MPVTWNDNDPADGDVAFPDGAGEIRRVQLNVRTLLNELLTANAAMSPPATLADYDSQIAAGPAATPTLRLRGDVIDLRSCTFRHASDTSATTTPITTVSPTFTDISGLSITITPVSASSRLEFHVQGLFTIQDANNWTGNDLRRGLIRIFNFTASSALAPVAQLPAHNNVAHWIHLSALVTGVSAATEFRVQGSVGIASTDMIPRGDLEPLHFYVIEHV